MEAETMRGTAYLNVAESTFDRIDSPQYLNFSGCIPEAKDSYFERKVEDDTPKHRNSKKLQRLPIDFEDDFIQPREEVNLITENNNGNNEVKEEVNLSEDNDRNNEELPNDFGDDLIQAVQTLKVRQSFANNAKEIVTSTPFRIPGVEPMPWRTHAKPAETKQYTKTRPFSFEERNKQIMQRKAHRIQTLIQAEKEARKFCANPVPKFLKKTTSNNSNPTLQGTLTTAKKSKSTETDLAPPRFKAKSPTVLRRPAFQPNLPRQPILPPKPFALSSELRARDREIFDNYIKEKERLDQRLRELREAAQKRREEEEVIKMRKEMVTKAQPIRKFKCVSTPVVKRPLTEPMTPKVIKRQRR